ncbi:MAG: hypothetical protein ACOCXP_03165 [Candidatus Dojkabacteria bacterium]
MPEGQLEVNSVFNTTPACPDMERYLAAALATKNGGIEQIQVASGTDDETVEAYVKGVGNPTGLVNLDGVYYVIDPSGKILRMSYFPIVVSGLDVPGVNEESCPHVANSCKGVLVKTTGNTYLEAVSFYQSYQKGDLELKLSDGLVGNANWIYTYLLGSALNNLIDKLHNSSLQDLEKLSQKLNLLIPSFSSAIELSGNELPFYYSRIIAGLDLLTSKLKRIVQDSLADRINGFVEASLENLFSNMKSNDDMVANLLGEAHAVDNKELVEEIVKRIRES